MTQLAKHIKSGRRALISILLTTLFFGISAMNVVAQEDGAEEIEEVIDNAMGLVVLVGVSVIFLYMLFQIITIAIQGFQSRAAKKIGISVAGVVALLMFEDVIVDMIRSLAT